MVYFCYTEAKRAADVKSAKEPVITMEQTNCEKHYEIDEKSLLEEILITIGDYFFLYGRAGGQACAAFL